MAGWTGFFFLLDVATRQYGSAAVASGGVRSGCASRAEMQQIFLKVGGNCRFVNDVLHIRESGEDL